MKVTFRPLGPWQGERTRHPRSGPFRSSFSRTMEDLEHELEQLGAYQVVVQIDVAEDDIRLDGWPRANSRPGNPGVAISFESVYGPLRYATDRFLHWHENLRAITLGLRALRAVDRYGITKSGEQYTGWKQLTAGTGPTTIEQARLLLQELTGWADVDASTYKLALKAAHPDHGGSTEKLMAVREAGRLLGVS